MARPVHNVNLVAFLAQHGRPATPAVRRAHPVQTLPAAAVHQHDRIRMPHLGRNLILDVHLRALDHGARLPRLAAHGIRQRRALNAYPKETPLSNIQSGTRTGGNRFRTRHQTRQPGNSETARNKLAAAEAGILRGFWLHRNIHTTFYGVRGAKFEAARQLATGARRFTNSAGSRRTRTLPPAARRSDAPE